MWGRGKRELEGRRMQQKDIGERRNGEKKQNKIPQHSCILVLTKNKTLRSS